MNQVKSGRSHDGERVVVNQSSGHFQNGQCTLLCDFQGLPLFRDEGMKRVLPGIAIMCHAHYRERGVLSKLVAPRLFALFCGGWLLFNFPLPGLWVLDLTLMGLPLLVAAWLGLWAGLIGTLACLIERHTKTEKVHSPCCHQCWLVALHLRICCFCLGWQAGGLTCAPRSFGHCQSMDICAGAGVPLLADHTPMAGARHLARARSY